MTTAVPASTATPAMFAALTADLVAAFVRGNTVPPMDIPILIEAIYGALRRMVEGEEPSDVPARKSTTPDYIICLERGEKLKALKRCLRSRYRMTPTEHRTYRVLSPNYPMAAETTAGERSAMAKRIGPGRRSRGRHRRT